MSLSFLSLRAAPFSSYAIFSSGADHHRDPHPFPTRRSSDLAGHHGQAAGHELEEGVRESLDARRQHADVHRGTLEHPPDRKSTRLNSSHLVISYAVFCL